MNEVIIMKKIRQRKNNMRKQYMIAAGVCIVSAVSLFAIYDNVWKADTTDEYIVDLTEIEEAGKSNETVDEKKEVATNNAKAENFENEDIFGWDNVMDATDEVMDAEDEARLGEGDAEDEKVHIVMVDEEELQEAITTEAITKPISLSFEEKDKLVWPVNGNVVLNYSMDKSIYFSTLKQYRYNPALIIASEEGSPVLSAARGQVIHMEEQSETGTTLTMDLGNDYKLTYGQLKDICVEAGEVVEQGQVIGYVAAPSKSYSVEGDNLYLKLARSNQAVNPMEYLQ